MINKNPKIRELKNSRVATDFDRGWLQKLRQELFFQSKRSLASIFKKSSTLMLDRRVLRPSGYLEHSCVLVSYRIPLVQHCFIICRDEETTNSETIQSEILYFILSEAERLAKDCIGDPGAYFDYFQRFISPKKI